MQLFGALLSETILFPVPHRHFTFGIPKMLRPYFRYDRDLLKDLCPIAHECLLEYLRTTLNLPDGLPSIVMTIHSFGEYLDWYPHLHACVADGLFYVLPEVSLKALEELFRARGSSPSSWTRGSSRRSAQECCVGGCIPASTCITAGVCYPTSMKTWSAWPNTSSVFALRAAPRHVRNPFAVEKMQVGAPSRAHPDGSIIYRSGLNPKNQRNFEVFTPCDFIAAITQHIPGKSFQLVRYYGWYSNPAVAGRGQREKRKSGDSGHI